MKTRKLSNAGCLHAVETTQALNKGGTPGKRIRGWIAKYKLLVILVLISCVITGTGLAVFDLAGFSNSPVHIPVRLASHFGELRPNHFHMGVDIRTNGRENIPVYAIKDGYVSRVRIEEGGTGRCLFIQQTNGTISVYGHLNAFFGPLEQFIHEKQYRECNWLQDVQLAPGQFPVRKGMLLAYSGNTGQSEAPHLHFEIREAKTGRSIDPQQFGIGSADPAAPELKDIYWYDRSVSVYQARKQLFLLTMGNTAADPVLISAPLIGLGVTAVCKIDDHHHSDGITHASVLLDGNKVFSFSLDSVSEADAKSINATIDYPLWYSSGKYVQYLFSVPENSPSFYKGNGSLNIGDGKVHQIEIGYGSGGNSHFHHTLFVKYVHAAASRRNRENTPVLKPGVPHTVTGEDVRVNYPARTFYDAVTAVPQKVFVSDAAQISSVYNLGDGSAPVRDSFSVSLRASLPRASVLRYRTVMVLVNRRSRIVVKGRWAGNWMTGKFAELGTIYLAADTSVPVIAPTGWVNNQMFTDEARLQITCEDGSGLRAVRATLDGHWILITKKDDVFTYLFDEHCPPGKHKLIIQATDIAGNSTRRTFYFRKG